MTKQELQKLIAEEIAAALKEGPMPIDNTAADNMEGPVAPQVKGLGASRSKVERIFTQLNRRGMDRMLGFLSNDVEKAQAIIKFADMVGVPSNKIPQLIANLRARK